MQVTIPGTEGYAEQANELVERYEAVAFADKYPTLLHLLPGKPGRVLDIGAGTGADAAWFASLGHAVVAVEPTDELRRAGMARHCSSAIEWIKDAFPDLDLVRGLARQFDLVTVTAVWMHLNEAERRQAMPHLVSLLAPKGVLLMSLRHGPLPAQRRMFDVAPEEAVSLAEGCGLRCLAVNANVPSVQGFNRNAGVTWSVLAFQGNVLIEDAATPEWQRVQ